MKIKNNKASKAAVNVGKAAKAGKARKAIANAVKVFSCSRVYTAFKKIDIEAYKKEQAELTTCAIRGGVVADFGTTSASGKKAFMMREGCTYGRATMLGTIETVGNDRFMRSGRFGLKLEKSDLLFGSFGELVAYVRKAGKAVKGERVDGQTFIHALGVGDAYGWAITGKGGLIRLENNSSSSCATRYAYDM
jgi:hypothetical protein